MLNITNVTNEYAGQYKCFINNNLKDSCDFTLIVKCMYIIIYINFLMDLSPFRQNFEKNRNRQKYHHSLKEHPTFTKIWKFGCEML